MQEYFPRAAASARLLVRSGGGISSVCTVCVWTTAWTTLITHMSYITIPRYNTTSWRALPQLGGETGGGWQKSWQRSLAVSLAYPGPPSAGPAPGFLHAGQNKVLPRQEAGPLGGILQVCTYVLLSSSRFSHRIHSGLEEVVGEGVAGRGLTHRGGAGGIVFSPQRRRERVRRGRGSRGKAGPKQGAAAFSEGIFQKEFQPSGTPARACLKMVWFLDTKRSFSGPEPCTCNSAVCG